MIEKCLREMFIDECSDEKRTLLAAIQGKSVQECQAEFSKQFKLDLVLRKEAILIEYSNVPEDDFYAKVQFEYLSFSERELNAMKFCSGVEFEPVEVPIAQFGWANSVQSYRIPLPKTLKLQFHNELSLDEKVLIAKKIRSYQN